MASPVSIGNYPVGVALTPIGISANYTANPADFVIVNATGLTVTLPTAPAAGTQVGINGYQIPGNATIVASPAGDVIFRNNVSVASTKLYNYTLILAYYSGGWRVVSDSQPYAAVAAARGYRTAALSLASTWNLVSIDTITFDSGGNMSTGVYKAPTAGTYFATGAVVINNPANGTQQGCGIWRNGVIGSGNNGMEGNIVPTSAGFQTFATASGIVSLAANDTLGLYAFTGVAGSLAAGIDFNNTLSVTPLA